MSFLLLCKFPAFFNIKKVLNVVKDIKDFKDIEAVEVRD